MNFLANFGIDINPVILSVVGILIISLFIYYLWSYQWPAKIVINELKKINSQLSTINPDNLSVNEMSNIDNVFIKKPFSHLWKEYSHSLHTVVSADGFQSLPRAT